MSILHSFSDWPSWGIKRMKRTKQTHRHMCRKVGVEKSQHPRSSICSLYPVGEVARIIAESCARRWGYYIQRNKEAAFLSKAESKGKVWLI